MRLAGASMMRLVTSPTTTCELAPSSRCDHHRRCLVLYAKGSVVAVVVVVVVLCRVWNVVLLEETKAYSRPN